MKLLKFLALAVPLAFLASCGADGGEGGGDKPGPGPTPTPEPTPSPTLVLKSFNAAEVLKVTSLKASDVASYNISLSNSDLTITAKNVDYEEKGTSDKDDYRSFYNKKTKDLLVYSKLLQDTLKTDTFSALNVASTPLKSVTFKGRDNTAEFFSSTGKMESSILKSFTSVQNVEFSNIIFKDSSFASLFEGSSNLTSVIFDGCNTSEVKDMSKMFKETKVNSTRFDGLDTKSVTNFSHMFSTVDLQHADLSSYDFTNATDISSMFEKAGHDAGAAGVLASSGISPFKRVLEFDPHPATKEEAKDGIAVGDQVVTAFKGKENQRAVKAIDLFKDTKGTIAKDLEPGDGLSSMDSAEIIEFFELTATDIKSYMIKKVRELPKSPTKGYTLLDSKNKTTAFEFNQTTGDLIFYGLVALQELTTANFNAFTALENVTINDLSSGVALNSCFKGLKTLTKVTFDGTKFGKTSFEGLFDGCSALTTVEFSQYGTDTSEVTSTKAMFRGTAITTTAIPRLNVTSVSDADEMFADCTALATADLSQYTFSSVKSVSGMFKNSGTATATAILPLSSVLSFDVHKATKQEADKTQGFVNVGDDVVTVYSGTENQSVAKATDIFTGTKGKIKENLTPVKFTSYKSADIIAGFGVEASAITNVIFVDEALYNIYTTPQGEHPAMLSPRDSGNDTFKLAVGDFGGSLSVAILPTTKISTFSADLFSAYTGLKMAGLSNIIADKGTVASNLFKGFKSLEQINFLDFDFKDTTSLASFFEGCTNLNTINSVTNDYITPTPLKMTKVTDVSNMFKGCAKLTSIPNCLDTSNVTKFDSMFEGCSGLTSVDISVLDFKKATSINSMFKNAGSDNVSAEKSKKSTEIDLANILTATSENKTEWDASSKPGSVVIENDKFVKATRSVKGELNFPVQANDLFTGASQSLKDALTTEAKPSPEQKTPEVSEQENTTQVTETQDEQVKEKE